MRTIKFRGLRTDGKGWVYGNLIKIESGQCYIFNYHFIPAFLLRIYSLYAKVAIQKNTIK